MNAFVTKKKPRVHMGIHKYFYQTKAGRASQLQVWPEKKLLTVNTALCPQIRSPAQRCRPVEALTGDRGRGSPALTLLESTAGFQVEISFKSYHSEKGKRLTLTLPH